jgi:8-oxo-dGTP diphosphatase
MSRYCGSCGHTLPGAPPVPCSSCGVMQWNDAKPCACALVVWDSRLLMVRRAQEPWKHMWDVPGGFCSPGEHPTSTARREVFEEAGLDIRIVGFLGMWLDEYAEPGAIAKTTLNIYYHAVPSGPVRLSPDGAEVVEAQFFAASDLPDAIAFPGHVPAALDAWRRAVEAGAVETELLDADERTKARTLKFLGE